MSILQEPTRSRLAFRRRLIEILILLWLAAYLYSHLQTGPGEPTGTRTPAAAAAPEDQAPRVDNSSVSSDQP